jgi:prophage DNA circulation protein
MARDWLKAFRPASFRGVGFQVDGEDAAGARRLSLSPIAYSDRTVIEDMGGEPRRFNLTAYVAGDVADTRATALVAALSPKGSGLLMLPMLGAVRARIVSWRLSREKRVAGYVSFDIEAVEEGLGSVPFGPVAGAQPISDLFVAGSAVLGAALAAAFPASAASRETAETDAAVAAAARLASIAADVTSGAAPSADLSSAIEVLATAAAAASRSPSAFADALVGGWNALALAADPETARQPLAEALSGMVPSGLAETAEASSLAGALAIVSVGGSYAAQQDASAARSALASSASPVLAACGVLGADVFAWLSGVTGQAALALSRAAASRVPLVRVETMLSLSAVRAAYDLYGDANRAGELVDRNHVATPAFLPLVFDALAA